jgi:hypothetical protein
VNASVNFNDPNGDVASLLIFVTTGQGVTVSVNTSATSGVLSGSVAAHTSVIGNFLVTAQVFDRAGNASNILSGRLEVGPVSDDLTVTLASQIEFLRRTPNQSHQAHLVASSGEVFWSDGSDVPIKKVPVSGGLPIPLATRVDTPVGLTTTGDRLVWLIRPVWLRRPACNQRSADLCARW